MSTAPLDDGRRRILEALAERLLPAGDGDPGALDAGVADYVVRALANGHRGRLPEYESGLDALDAHAVATAGAGLAALPADAQDELVAALERGEVPGAPPGFFGLVRAHVIEGMFGDPGWGGNRGGAGWRLLGYPGPQLVWTAEEQALGPEEPS